MGDLLVAVAARFKLVGLVVASHRWNNAINYQRRRGMIVPGKPALAARTIADLLTKRVTKPSREAFEALVSRPDRPAFSPLGVPAHICLSRFSLSTLPTSPSMFTSLPTESGRVPHPIYLCTHYKGNSNPPAPDRVSAPDWAPWGDPPGVQHAPGGQGHRPRLPSEQAPGTVEESETEVSTLTRKQTNHTAESTTGKKKYCPAAPFKTVASPASHPDWIAHRRNLGIISHSPAPRSS